MRAYFSKSTRRRLSYLLFVIVLCIGFIDNRVPQKEAVQNPLLDTLHRSANRSWELSREKRPHSNKILRNETEYFSFLNKPSEFRCQKLITLGGYSCRKYVDGNKEICLDEGVRPPMKNCLVYSFGVGNDASFEGSLHSLYGCEIHMFDPTINASWVLEDINGTNTHFHARGLAAGDTVYQIVSPNSTLNSYTYSTFGQILRDNGHLGRTIHYLKMDIESGEWEALPNMIDQGLLNNVLQIGMEIHANHLEHIPFSEWLPTLQKQYDILSRLEEIGFRKISYRENFNMVGFLHLPFEKSGRPSCGEILYIRNPKKHQEIT
ncbi:hypothetical protein SK128_022557 [Halocaridina rubra]|uniref:Methyltransferase domain-containing protein n=1 Tax=Halocaridina rubra TaxID=373956 RepID=A0AAN8WX82_HALRR